MILQAVLVRRQRYSKTCRFDVHVRIVRKLAELVLHVVSADQAAIAEISEMAELLAELEGLRRKLTRGRKDKPSSAELERMLLQFMKERQHERGSLAGTCSRHGHHIRASHDHGNGLTLDWRGHLVALTQDCLEHLVRQTCIY